MKIFTNNPVVSFFVHVRILVLCLALTACTTADLQKSTQFLNELSKAVVAQKSGTTYVPAAAPIVSTPAKPDSTYAVPSANNVSRTNTTGSTSHCIAKLEVERNRLEAVRKSVGNNALASIKTLIQSNQYQVDLFSGECAAHPEASSYVSVGRRAVAEWQADCRQRGGNSDCQPVSNFSNGSTSTTSNPNNSAAGGTRIIWDGALTNCASYKARPRQSSNSTQWYEMTNACNTPINVWTDDSGQGYFGSMSPLRPGQTSSSWWNIHKVPELKFVACRQKTINDEDVHLDKQTLNCYFRNKIRN